MVYVIVIIVIVVLAIIFFGKEKSTHDSSLMEINQPPSSAPQYANLSSVTESSEIVPEGWKLVRRKSDEWYHLGFGDGDSFPGYGKIYERTFDVWYCNVGSREKSHQGEFTDKALLNFYGRICGINRIDLLKDKNVQFDGLEKTQGYTQLLSGLDEKERRRWYFGLKKHEPTYIYTAAAE